MKKLILSLMTVVSIAASADAVLNVGALNPSLSLVTPVAGEVGLRSTACYPMLSVRDSSKVQLRFITSTDPLAFKSYPANAYCEVTIRDWIYGFPTPDVFGFRSYTHSSCEDPTRAGKLSRSAIVSIECKSDQFKALRRLHRGQPLKITIRHFLEDSDLIGCDPALYDCKSAQDEAPEQ